MIFFSHANKQNPYGLLLLCEVALGNMYLKRQAEMISKLAPQYHSCKGEGQYAPDTSTFQSLYVFSLLELGFFFNLKF